MTVGHLGGARHQRNQQARLAAGLHVPTVDNMLQPGPVHHTRVGRCRWCSLNPDGPTRTTHAYQMPPTAWVAHVGTADHQRRGGDGRPQAYLATHPPGPHQQQAGDTW
jgi:hypothetical protein